MLPDLLMVRMTLLKRCMLSCSMNPGRKVSGAVHRQPRALVHGLLIHWRSNPVLGFATVDRNCFQTIQRRKRTQGRFSQASAIKSFLCLLFKVFKCLLDHRLNHRHYKVEPFNTKIHFQGKIPLWERAFHGTGLDNNSITCNRMYEMFDDKQSFSAL